MAGRLSWTITATVTDQTINTDASQTVVGAYVYFRTGKGNTGNVFIPNNQFTIENVKVQVRATAKLLDDINDLSENME